MTNLITNIRKISAEKKKKLATKMISTGHFSAFSSPEKLIIFFLYTKY